MSSLPLPTALVYAALGGTLLALLWATAVNRWSLKVFFLLALRLAIGWHFLFEGIHKLHSHYVGQSETSRPFSSEMYFTLGEGPAAAAMRKRLNDVDAQLAAKLSDEKVPAKLKEVPAAHRTGYGPDGQTPEANARDAADPETDVREMVKFAGMVPPAVKKEWDDFVAAFADKYKLSEAEKKKVDGTLDEDEFRELVAYRKAATAKERAEIAEKAGLLVGDQGTAALAAYGRWVAGVEGRDTKVKYVSGQDPMWTAPQRLEYVHHREADLKALQDRSDKGLGHGYGLDQKKMTEIKQLVNTARADLVKDADALLAKLKGDAVNAVIDARFETKAPGPGKVLGGLGAEKIVALLPPEKGPENASFDQLPEDIRKVWDAYHREYKAAYPLGDAAEKVDRAYDLMKTRLANWYFGRDEYSGRPAPGKGFAAAAKKYRDALARADKFKTKADALPVPPPAPKEEPKAADPAADTAAAGFAGAIARAAHKPAAAAGSGASGPGLAFSLTRAAALTGADLAKKEAAAAPDLVLAALTAKFTDLKDALRQKEVTPAEVLAGPVTTKPDRSFIERLDKVTMWAITAIGALLLVGLFTRLAGLAGVVFLVMTYLTHPPFPWYPLPPGTEGNPVYVNKNAIEALALLVVLTFPTGRWLGLDALLHRVVFRNHKDYIGPPKRSRKAKTPPPPAAPVTGRA